MHTVCFHPHLFRNRDGKARRIAGTTTAVLSPSYPFSGWPRVCSRLGKQSHGNEITRAHIHLTNLGVMKACVRTHLGRGGVRSPDTTMLAARRGADARRESSRRCPFNSNQDRAARSDQSSDWLKRGIVADRTF